MQRFEKVITQVNKNTLVIKAVKVLQRMLLERSKIALILFVPFWIGSVRELMERII